MKIVCAGEMLVDILVRSVEQVPLTNDTQLVQQIQLCGGGDAHNNAVDLARLGHQVVYLGRLGQDELGDYLMRASEKAGVDMSHAVRSSTAEQTKSLILANAAGDRTFLQIPGTSAEFSLSDCDLSVLHGAGILQIAGTFHLPRFDGEGAAALLRAAREQGVVTSMDVTSSRSGQWQGILDPCYPCLDYFLPSIEQAVPISGLKDPEAIADYFLNRGVQNVVIKLGRQGSFFKNREIGFYAGIYSGLHLVEPTGAGDAFCAGFLHGIAQGAAPQECVAYATACSSMVIQSAGATAGMPAPMELEQFLREHTPLTFTKI